MNVVYKLTTQDMTTRGGFQWELGKWRHAARPPRSDGYPELCTRYWLHCYANPLIAVIMNPLHADIENPRLFVAHAAGSSRRDGFKLGYRRMKLVKELVAPRFTIAQLRRFAILCALEEVLHDSHFVAWALHWLDGDKSQRPFSIPRLAEDAVKTVREKTLHGVKERAAWATLRLATLLPLPADGKADVYFARLAAEALNWGTATGSLGGVKKND